MGPFFCLASAGMTGGSDLRGLMFGLIPTSYYQGTPSWLDLSTFLMKTLPRVLALSLVLLLCSRSHG